MFGLSKAVVKAVKVEFELLPDTFEVKVVLPDDKKLLRECADGLIFFIFNYGKETPNLIDMITSALHEDAATRSQEHLEFAEYVTDAVQELLSKHQNHHSEMPIICPSKIFQASND